MGQVEVVGEELVVGMGVMVVWLVVGGEVIGDNRYGSGGTGREVGHKTKDRVSGGTAVQREVMSGVTRV